MWQNGGHAGADVVAANNGRVPDFDTGNIGDRIERSGRQDTDFQPRSNPVTSEIARNPPRIGGRRADHFPQAELGRPNDNFISATVGILTGV
jgi:hypothetical protein